MERNYLMLLMLSLIILSCGKNGVSPRTETSLKSLWQPNITDGVLLPWEGVSTNISYNGNVLYGGGKDGKLIYYMTDGQSGEILWEWNDFIGEQTAMNPVKVYQYQHYLILQKSYTTYCIDLSDGTTAWKKQNSKHLGYVT